MRTAQRMKNCPHNITINWWCYTLFNFQKTYNHVIGLSLFVATCLFWKFPIAPIHVDNMFVCWCVCLYVCLCVYCVCAAHYSINFLWYLSDTDHWIQSFIKLLLALRLCSHIYFIAVCVFVCFLRVCAAASLNHQTTNLHIPNRRRVSVLHHIS